jgi:uncharacterized protein (TIGR02118 family)
LTGPEPAEHQRSVWSAASAGGALRQREEGEYALHKFVVLYPPQPDPEKFKSYYINTHIPLARKIPGLLASRYSFSVGGLPPGSPAPYWCIFEADFADAASMGAGMGSPEGQATAADVPNFAQVPPTLMHFAVDG